MEGEEEEEAVEDEEEESAKERKSYKKTKERKEKRRKKEKKKESMDKSTVYANAVAYMLRNLRDAKNAGQLTVRVNLDTSGVR